MSLFFVLVCRILPSCTSKTFLVCSLWFAGNNVPVSQITKQHLWLGIERKWLWRLRITEFQQNRSCCVHGIKFCWVNLKSPSLPDTQNWSFVVCFVVCRIFSRQKRNPRIPVWGSCWSLGTPDGRIWSGDFGPSPADVPAPFTLPLLPESLWPQVPWGSGALEFLG